MSSATIANGTNDGSGMSDGGPRSGDRGRWLTGGVVVLIVGGAVGWASATVLTPPKDVLASTAFTTVEVVNGEVGSSINMNTVAEWSPIPVGTNLAAGTVTTVDVAAGDEVSSGSRLYSVNLRPVVVAAGAIPSFQSLSRGSKGQDVAQLQAMLTTGGFYGGAVDGGFGYLTERAVWAWQKSLGVAQDGVVQALSLIHI